MPQKASKQIEVGLISFDATNTLFAPNPSVGRIYTLVSSDFGIDADEHKITDAFHDMWQETKRGSFGLTHGFSASDQAQKLWWFNFVKLVFKRVGVEHYPDEACEALYDTFSHASAWKLFPETLDVLDELVGRGHTLAIVSNFDSRLRGICEELGVLDYIQHVIISSEVGTEKPEKAIFGKVLKATRTKPERAVHVGDDKDDDYDGARNAGMHSILVDRRKHHNDGVLRITKLTELLKIVQP